MNKLGRKDLIIMLIITVLYGALLFFRLGSTEAPVNGYRMTETNGNEIVLDFGSEKTVGGVNVFLGHTGVKYFNIYLSEADSAFEKNLIQNAFAWNSVSVKGKTTSLTVQNIKGDAQIMEMVILDEKGEILTPVNADSYPGLFDEQSLFVRQPTFMNQSMFDEIYHARTAYEFINGYDVYEVTHPHLGKSIMTLGIRAFGMTPFGWRFICALFGTLMIPLMYLLAWQFTKNRKSTVLSTLLLCTQFMHFTLSRIGTIDVIVAFFIMLMFLFMARFVDSLGESAKKQYLNLFLCGCASALAVATKWTGMYAMAGVAVIFFACLVPECLSKEWTDETNRRLLKLGGVCVVSFIIIPMAVYLLSFLPLKGKFPNLNLVQIAIKNSGYMFKYHAENTSYHTYASRFHEWLIGTGALLDSSNYVGDKISIVVTMGNPFIALLGLVSLVHNFVLWIKSKDISAKQLCIAYVAMLLPWMFISRSQFIYQYYVCTLILSLLIGNSAKHIKNATGKAVAVLVISAVLFVLYYPLLSGLPVPPPMFKYLLFWN